MLLDNSCDREVLIDLIGKIEEVVSVKLIEEYHGPQIEAGKVSLTFNYTTYNKKDKDIVEKYLRGIGGKIR